MKGTRGSPPAEGGEGRDALVEVAAAPRHPAWWLGNLLDVRPAALFAGGHAVAAVNLPLPPPAAGSPVEAGALARLLPPPLLPPRHEPLLVFAASPQQALAVRDFLRRRGRPRVDACAAPAGALAGLPAAAVAAGPATGRLWRPPGFLREHAALLPPPAAGPVLDLGAGGGRAAVWLAERGYDVTAVDRDAEALDVTAHLAVTAGVDPRRLTLLKRDLRDPAQTPAGPWAAALSFRFLDRPLLGRLPGRLRPGGVVIVRALRREPADHATPRRSHRLEPGELPRLLPDPPLETLVHQEDRDPDGRPAAGIVARLRA